MPPRIAGLRHTRLIAKRKKIEVSLQKGHVPDHTLVPPHGHKLRLKQPECYLECYLQSLKLRQTLRGYEQSQEQYAVIKPGLAIGIAIEKNRSIGEAPSVAATSSGRCPMALKAFCSG